MPQFYDTLNWVALVKLADSDEMTNRVLTAYENADKYRGDQEKEPFALQTVADLLQVEAYRQVNQGDGLVAALARKGVDSVNWKWVADRMLDKAVRGWDLTVE